MKLKIGTYNIQHGKHHGHFLKGGREVIDLPGDAAVLRGAGLDICGLNEVRNQEQVAVLETTQSDHRPYTAMIEW